MTRLSTILAGILLLTYPAGNAMSQTVGGEINVAKTDYPENILPLQRNLSTIPVAVPLRPLYNQIEAGLLHLQVNNQDWNGDRGGSCNDGGWTHIIKDKWEKHEIFIDEIKITNPSENILDVFIKVHYTFWGKDKNVSVCSSGNCDNDGLYQLSFDLMVDVPDLESHLGRSWLANINKYDRDCKLSFFDHSATDDLICSLDKSINASISSVLNRDFIFGEAEKMLTKIPLDFSIQLPSQLPTITIKTNFQSATIGKIGILNDTLKTLVGIYASPTVKTTDVNSSISIQQPLPNERLSISDLNAGLNLTTGVQIVYASIENALKELVFKNLQIHPTSGMGRIVNCNISDIKITGDDSGFLNVFVTISGRPSGTISLRCYPSFNSLSNTIVLSSISYRISSRNLLVKLIEPFFKKPINSVITENTTIALNQLIVNLTGKIQGVISQQSIQKWVTASVTNPIARIINVKPTKEYLQLHVNLSADARVIFNPQSIKIPLPTSPYKPKAGPTCEN